MSQYGGAPYGGAPYGAGFIAPTLTDGVLFNTIRDAAGSPVASCPVDVRLMPYAGFRTDGTEVARMVSTTSAADGSWALPLYGSALISPANTYYQVTEYIPEVRGGKRVWLVRVTAGSAISVFSAQVTTL
jgi:hypothetical protein